jgi:hypothetical protein
MPGRYQHQIDAANRSSFPKWQWMLDARARQTDPHQACCAFRNDHFLVRRDVVTVRVGNERETFSVPWVQPEILLRQVDTALIANFDHAENYFAICVSSIARVIRMSTVGCALTPASGTRFITEMRFAAALLVLTFLAVSAPGKTAREEPKVVEKVTPLPVALDPNFEFRKTKLFFMSEKGLKPSERAHDSTNKLGGKSNSPSQKTATLQDAPIVFERQYRLFGAVTGLDQRQRFGDYFDFFWRAKRPSDVTVRLEYRQEKLHEHVQAQEITYRSVRGTHKTEFKVIGDDYFDDGRVIAWRCLLVANGRIVAENRSFLWE